MYIIYKHTNKLNNKSYIGFTKRGMNIRLNEHIKGQSVFSSALRKYGKESFKSEILETVETKIEANTIEIYFISFYESFGKGYNVTKGGEGGSYKWTTLQKEKHKIRMKTVDNSHKWSDERKLKQKNIVGHLHPCFGRVVLEEQKKTQSLKMKGKNKGKYMWISNKNVSTPVKIIVDNIYDYVMEGWYKGRKMSHLQKEWKLISKDGDIIVCNSNIKKICSDMKISWNILRKKESFIDENKIHWRTLKNYPNTHKWRLSSL